MARKKKHGATIYTIFLMLYVLILAVAAFYGLTKVWTYAEEYEAARPDKTMDAYIKELSKNLWDDSIAETIAAMPHEVQTDEECKEIVRNMLSDELSYARQPGYSEESTRIKYNLLCGGNVFGNVTLVPDESKSKDVEFDMLPWIVSTEEFDFYGLYSSMQITVPATYSVTLNGVKLGNEYIVEDGIHYDVLEDYYDQYPGLPTKVTYRFDDIFGHLEPVVYDENGNETTIDETRDDSQYIQPVSAEVLSRLETFAGEFSDAYLAFSSGVADPMYAYSRVLPYIEVGGDLDSRLKQSMDGYGWAHTASYRFDSSTVNNAIFLGDGCYMVDVTAHTTTIYPNKGDNGVVSTDNGLKLIVKEMGGEFRAVTVERYL